MQLRPVARRPAGPVLALKPQKPIVVAHAAKGGTLPNSGLRPFLPRISHSSAPLPAAPCSVWRMGRCSFPPAPRTMARDEAEREPAQQVPPANLQGEEEAAAERTPAPAPRGERSMAYQLFAALYVCAYVFFWRTGELITLNAQEALERLRRYVRDNFFNNRK